MLGLGLGLGLGLVLGLRLGLTDDHAAAERDGGRALDAGGVLGLVRRGARDDVGLHDLVRVRVRVRVRVGVGVGVV